MLGCVRRCGRCVLLCRNRRRVKLSYTMTSMTDVARPPEAWIDDVAWHRQMLRQSRLRWTHEHAMAIALHFTRGQLEYRSHRDLERLNGQHLDLLGEASAVRRAIAGPLKTVEGQDRVSWVAALDVTGMSDDEADLILWQGTVQGSDGTRETRRVASGLPWSNPLTQVWELRQLESLYDAAVAILEDAVCDLANELVTEWRDLAEVAPLTTSRSPGQLLLRIEENRTARGAVGDPRRQRSQRYEPTSVRPSPTGSVSASAVG